MNSFLEEVTTESLVNSVPLLRTNSAPKVMSNELKISKWFSYLYLSFSFLFSDTFLSSHLLIVCERHPHKLHMCWVILYWYSFQVLLIQSVWKNFTNPNAFVDKYLLLWIKGFWLEWCFCFSIVWHFPTMLPLNILPFFQYHFVYYLKFLPTF